MSAFTREVQDTAALTRLTLAPGSDNVQKVDADCRVISILGKYVSREQPWTLERLEAVFGNSNSPVWIHRCSPQIRLFCLMTSTALASPGRVKAHRLNLS